MKLKINKVNSPGIIKNERVGFRALVDVQLYNYAVMDHTFTEDGDLSDKGRHVYRFPKKLIKEGDRVVLYTKEGNDSSEVKDTYTVHFFYWGRKAPVWNNNGKDTCTLMEVHDTQVVTVNED